MLKRILAVVITILIISLVGIFAMLRDDISIEALEQRYGYTDSQFASVTDQDVIIHFRDTGPRDAPTLLLLHGFSASLHTWQGWIDGLSEDYRVIAIDLPGHGLTRGPEDPERVNISFYVDLVARVLTELQVEKATLIGSSMGGHVSWAYTLENTDSVDALVLVGSAGVPPSTEEQKKQPAIFRLMRNGFIAQHMQNLDMTYFIRNALRDSFYDETLVTRQMVARYGNLSRGAGHRAILLNMQNESRAAFDFADLARVQTPTLIIHGAEDNVIPARHGRVLDQTLPNSTLHILDNIGHLPQEEAAETGLVILMDFLKQSQAAPATPEQGSGQTVE